MPPIRLQPKQDDLKELVDYSLAKIVATYGGRGCAKSFTLDALAILDAIENPGVVNCIAMRTSIQVWDYHIYPILAQWPELEPGLRRSIPIHLEVRCPNGQMSRIDFKYSENYDETEKKFRSGNYHKILIDQAEQFLEEELREISLAVRGGPNPKMILSFNMGGASIQTLKKWFYTHEVDSNDHADRYAGIHFYPWDNVYWARNALIEDGLTEEHYYDVFTDKQRQDYCAARTDYGQKLSSLPDALRNRDWLSSWDSLEGAYFGAVFDLKAVMITRQQVAELIKPWDNRWLGGDWGKAHYCVHYWNATTRTSPEDVDRILGWEIQRPLKIHITYRELMVNEMASPEVGAEIVKRTPVDERTRIKDYFLSPDAFGERDSSNTIADNLDKALRPYGMPSSRQADNDPDGGAMLMYQLLEGTKRHGAKYDEVWLISSECPKLLEALPMLMHDKKNLDRVLKTDQGRADWKQDVYDASRYSMKSMLSQGTKPKRVVLDETLADQQGMQRLRTIVSFEQKWKQEHKGLERVRRYR